jgi:hypothetical protein
MLQPASEYPTAECPGTREDRVAEHFEEAPFEEQRNVDRAKRQQRCHRVGIEHAGEEELDQFAIMRSCAKGRPDAPGPCHEGSRPACAFHSWILRIEEKGDRKDRQPNGADWPDDARMFELRHVDPELRIGKGPADGAGEDEQ